MIPFELVVPTSLGEAIGLLDPDDSLIRPIAGGTAVMLMMKAGIFRPRRLVSLHAIEPRYRGIETGPGGELYVGAMVSLAQLERSALVQREWPVITRTLRTLSNVRVRNVATIGGHLAHADPHMDLPPVLSTLGASVTIAGPRGERTVRVEELSKGYYETVLGTNELITLVTVPSQGRRTAAYLKCTARSADDWPALGVAVSLDMEGVAIRDAAVVISAATDRPMRLPAAEAVLRGGTVEDAILRRAGEAAAADVEIVGDARGSASYKKHLLRVYVGRAVRSALEPTLARRSI
jgi:carbon-monoxide dehydrogenase medium subunit